MTKKYIYLVTVETEKRDHADIIMSERMGYDEELHTYNAADWGPEDEIVFYGDAIRPEGAVPLQYSLDFTFMEAMTVRENS